MRRSLKSIRLLRVEQVLTEETSAMNLRGTASNQSSLPVLRFAATQRMRPVLRQDSNKAQLRQTGLRPTRRRSRRGPPSARR